MKDYEKAMTSSVSVTAPVTPELEPVPEECVQNKVTAHSSDASVEPRPAQMTGPPVKDMAIQCEIDCTFLAVEPKTMTSVGTSCKI